VERASQHELEAGFASRLLANQGYDSIEIRGTQTLVIILNPQQVAVFENESRTSDRLYGL
jgi:hypothetical protein